MFSIRDELSCYFVLSVFFLMAGCSSEPPVPTSKVNPQSESSTENTKTESNSDVNPTENTALTAKEYFKECYKDKEATLIKYQGKQIRLTGKLKSLHRGFIGRLNIRLSASENPEMLKDSDSPEVRIALVDSEKSPWTRMVLGQEITVEGVGEKKAGSIAALTDCRIIEIKGSLKPEFISADELEKDFSTDREAADKKWGSKLIYLTGTIKNLKRENSQVELGDDQKTTALLKTEDRFDLEHLKPGQKIQVLGKYSKYPDQDDVPEITNFLLISPQRPEANIKPTKMVGSIPHFTADWLAEAFGSDPRRFAERYKKDRGKFQIEGTIDTIEKDQSGWLVQFKNSRKHDIDCQFSILTKAEVEALKPGNHVTIRGSLFSYYSRDIEQDEPIPLTACEVIP